MKEHNFKPAWWLPGPHSQTLWPTLSRRKLKFPSREERLELADGDFIDLVWVGESGPIVLILHGMEGSVDSPYAVGMLSSLSQAGFRAVLMHFRGCSGEPNRLARGYHSGDTADLATVIEHLSRQEAPQAALGYSLEANLLLKWLGETGAANPLKAAVAVSVPFELAKTCTRVQQGFSQVYQWHLLRSVRQRLKAKFKHYPHTALTVDLDEIKTLWDFDEQVTAPLHGFESALDYYHQSSSRAYLAKIQVPTLIIQAKDDPFMSDDLIPTAAELSMRVKLELCARGGHVGFVSGRYPWRPQYWLEQRVPSFLTEML